MVQVLLYSLIFVVYMVQVQVLLYSLIPTELLSSLVGDGVDGELETSHYYCWSDQHNWYRFDASFSHTLCYQLRDINFILHPLYT